MATTMPASVWTVRSTYSFGIRSGLAAALGLAAANFLWSGAAAALLFYRADINYLIDPPLRIIAVILMVHMAWEVKRSRSLESLHLHSNRPKHMFRSTWLKAITMPWRFPLWLSIIMATGIHLRAPGLGAAFAFALAAFCGSLAWHVYFALLTQLFGRRVPESVSLKSLNKLRFLSFTVLLGLAILILAPLPLRLSY